MQSRRAREKFKGKAARELVRAHHHQASNKKIFPHWEI